MSLIKSFLILVFASLSLVFVACDRSQSVTIARIARPAPTTKAKTKSSPATERRFAIRYTAIAEGLKAGAPVRMWIPIPGDDGQQTITGLKVKAPLTYRFTQSGLNRMAYLEGPAPGESFEVVVDFEVDRSEHAGYPVGEEASDLKAALSALTVVNADIEAAAAKAIKGKSDTMDKARALYDHTLEHMSYDKSGEGWGQGSSIFACEVGKGNCTDFHAYFMALCFSAQIPTRFQIGLYGKAQADAKSYETGGYHCWAEFQAGGQWIPVDISEADKDPSKREYFFGHHSPNRVTLSIGRDLVLEPAQKGPALNYFVNPYVEVDGAVHTKVRKRTTWTDLKLP